MTPNFHKFLIKVTHMKKDPQIKVEHFRKIMNMDIQLFIRGY